MSESPVLSVSPVTVPAPGRAVELRVRVSAPMTGDGLPIILLSHGLGFSNHLSSLNGYAPLVNFWAARGFAVIQPTHLDSKTLSLEVSDAWRTRTQDMKHVFDGLDAIEAAVPSLAGRLDRDKVAVVGHSMGGHTASLLLGARVDEDLSEPRIKAGVLLAAPGNGGVTEFVSENYPFLSAMDFSSMTAPALVVAGEKDTSTHLTVRGAEWHADPYFQAPGPKALLSLVDAEHGLGGISGYDVAETTDENPDRVAVVQELTTAYLRSTLYPGDASWQAARDGLSAEFGHVESKDS
ncbi:Alpha/beta hydrolase family protein [Amycolatopsis xylanica]|uniref:Alpha/beta hydrolase family protein n=1 Tax=Amycolatopsis xylanica TaxID=589385 RepID=A0A1H3QDU4_9PSEU|nr:alpha/beta fold hydrolase [Amycolatopsis xylanica]SDZ11537.1 Alpha/beta hydrolase family protein [Amycolatopsis xylanica]